MFEKLTLNVAVVHVSGRRLARNSNQEMSHFRRQVAQREDREDVRFVQETQFFDVRMHDKWSKIYLKRSKSIIYRV